MEYGTAQSTAIAECAVVNLRIFAFLAVFVATSASAQSQLSANAARRIKIGIIDKGDSRNAGAGTNRGVAFGLEEARRTAQMFGWEITVARAPDSLTSAQAVRYLSRQEVTAIVGDLSETPVERSPNEPAPVILDIGQARTGARRVCGDARLHLLPTTNDREAMSVGAAQSAHSIPVAWHPSLERFGAGQLNERFRKRVGDDMDETNWAGWMAMKVLVDAALKSRTTDPRRLETYLMNAAGFDGHKGVPLYFHPTRRELVQPLFYRDAAGDSWGSDVYPRPDSSVARAGTSSTSCPRS